MRNKLQAKIKADMSQWEEIVALAEKEDRNLTEDELVTIDSLKASIDTNKTQLDALNTFDAVKSEVNKPQRQVQVPNGPVADFKPESNHVDVIPANISKCKVFKDAKTAYRASKWVEAKLFGHQPSIDWCNRNGVQLGATTMLGGTDNIGGSTVPDEFLPQIQEQVQEYGVFRNYANAVPMSSDVLVVPVKTAGMTATAEGEGDGIAEKNSTWKQSTLTAKKWAILTRMSAELNADTAVALVDNLFADMSRAFALAEDQAGFIGDGTSTYHSITGVATKINDSSGATYAASIYTPAATNLAFSDFSVTDFVGMIGKLPQFAGIRPAWFISKAGWAASMARLQMSAGGVGVADFAGGPSQVTFMGYPVVWTDVLNNTLTNEASTIKLLFGDLRLAALFGSRNGVQLAQSEHRYFDENEIALRGVHRFAIDVHSLGSDTVAGPMIALKTPSS